LTKTEFIYPSAVKSYKAHKTIKSYTFTIFDYTGAKL